MLLKEVVAATLFLTLPEPPTAVVRPVLELAEPEYNKALAPVSIVTSPLPEMMIFPSPAEPAGASLSA